MKKYHSVIECRTCNKIFIVKPCREKTAKTCSKKCFSFSMKNHAPYNYKGGVIRHKGYVYVLNKTHPNRDRDGYVLEHRMIMEKHIDRYLSSTEIVHHKNGVRNDNRISNLELLQSQSEHMKQHHTAKGLQKFQHST